MSGLEIALLCYAAVIVFVVGPIIYYNFTVHKEGCGCQRCIEGRKTFGDRWPHS